MATIFGITTYKADGTSTVLGTPVLQNSTPSAVFGQTFTLTDAGTGGTRTPEPISNGRFYYYKDFPEYVTRNIRPIQLRPGQHEWITGVTSGVPYIRWNRNIYVPSQYNIYVPEFSYTDTILYVFVK
jgi:hypothetical protein